MMRETDKRNIRCVVAFLTIGFLLPLVVVKINQRNAILLKGNIQNSAKELSYSSVGRQHTTETPVLSYANMTLEEVVKSRVNENKTIMLSLVDASYVEMALNLYETSFKKFGLDNYLFLCSDSESVKILESHNIASKQYTSLTTGGHASIFRSKEFKEKVRIKIKLVYEVLKLGYKVLLVDLDIVFLKNPFHYLKCTSCDMEIQWDHGTINSGFFLVKPTPGGLTAFEKAYQQAVTTQKDDQIILHSAIYGLRKSKQIKFEVLNDKQFPCGRVYFELGHRIFAGDNPCKECVMYHNNWIVSREAKIYRFKELLQWKVDTKGYYSDLDAKYLTYGNPVDFTKTDTLNKEINALKNALLLGHILNRTVILPGFHCYGCKHGCTPTTQWCSLATNIKLTNFDKYFDRKYREHMFLKHEQVPQIFKDSLVDNDNKMIILQTLKNKKIINESESESELFLTTEENFVSVENIKTWLNKYESQPLLKFHSLYEIFDLDTFISDNPDTSIAQGLQNGIKIAKPRQF